MAQLTTWPKLIVIVIVVLAGLIGLMTAYDPDSAMGATLAAFWAACIGVSLYRRENRKVDGHWWSRIIIAGLLLRLGMAFVQIMVGLWFYQGGVDFVPYHHGAVGAGQRLLQGHLDFNPGGRRIEAVVLENLMGLFYLLAGPGLIGMAMLSAVVGFIGCYLFLRAFQVEYPLNSKDSRFLALAIFFLPSLAFWGSYPGKDPWVLLFLGLTCYAFACLVRRFRTRYLLGIVVSLGGLVGLRDIVGGIVALALLPAWAVRPRKGPAVILRPIGLSVYGAAVVGMIMFMGSFFLNRQVGLLTDPAAFIDAGVETAVVIHKGYATEGESARGVEISEESVGGILRYLPKGMFSFLFRPMIFEAHHALALAAALEGTLFLIIIFWRWGNLIAAIRSAFTKPLIGFCVLTFIGLTTILALEANFGAIVRHRTMVLPFLLILLAVSPNRKRRGENLATP